MQWIDGDSEWVNDIVKRSEYRVVNSPKAEAIVSESFWLACCALSVDCSPNLGCYAELVLQQLITNVEEMEEQGQAAIDAEMRGKTQEQSPRGLNSAPSYLSDLLSKSGAVNTRVLVAVALALNGASDCPTLHSGF